MYANTAPPKPSLRAALSVIIPLEVEITAIPKPPKTLGNDLFEYTTLRPGLEIRFIPENNFFLVSSVFQNHADHVLLVVRNDFIIFYKTLALQNPQQLQS